MSKNSNSLKSYIFEICRDYKIFFLALFSISIIASLFEISVNYKVKEIIDAIAADKNAEISLLLGLFVAYKFAQHGMFFIVRLLNIRYKPKLRTRVTTDIYKKTMNHSLHWFDSHMSGEISDKINSFAHNLSLLITNIFQSFVIIWAIIIGMIFIAKISLLPALVQFGFLSVHFPILYFLIKKQLHLQGNFTRADQEVSGVINDSISNIFGIKIIGNIAHEFKLKLTPALLNLQKKELKTRRFDAFWVDNIDTIMIVAMAAAQIYLLAYLYKTDQITAGGFAFVAMIMLKVHGDITSLLEKVLFEMNPQIAKIRTSYEFINEKYDIIDRENARELGKIKGEIEFKKVSFNYNSLLKKTADLSVLEKNSETFLATPFKKNPILDNINLQIKAGEKIGLVGHSGAGKTTLIKSILRYFDINFGEILIDGNKISDISQESLRAQISIIPQDITMFHRSILENLQIAKYNATKEEIIAACKKAKIHDDILKMDKGYDSVVGERGVKVSGGQRQRIAIARAILKDAPILILDEATSALDSQTEKQIQESLNLLIKDKSKTVIAIAHRLSTLKHMDRIIVIDKGKIVEEGKHDELLKNKTSLYKQLWELQEMR